MKKSKRDSTPLLMQEPPLLSDQMPLSPRSSWEDAHAHSHLHSHLHHRNNHSNPSLTTTNTTTTATIAEPIEEQRQQPPSVHKKVAGWRRILPFGQKKQQQQQLQQQQPTATNSKNPKRKKRINKTNDNDNDDDHHHHPSVPQSNSAPVESTYSQSSSRDDGVAGTGTASLPTTHSHASFNRMGLTTTSSSTSGTGGTDATKHHTRYKATTGSSLIQHPTRPSTDKRDDGTESTNTNTNTNTNSNNMYSNQYPMLTTDPTTGQQLIEDDHHQLPTGSTATTHRRPHQQQNRKTPTATTTTTTTTKTTNKLNRPGRLTIMTKPSSSPTSIINRNDAATATWSSQLSSSLIPELQQAHAIASTTTNRTLADITSDTTISSPNTSALQTQIKTILSRPFGRDSVTLRKNTVREKRNLLERISALPVDKKTHLFTTFPPV